nr:MAG: putative RNA dependent RNA polymerase [Heilongjiang mito-like virus 8]
MTTPLPLVTWCPLAAYSPSKLGEESLNRVLWRRLLGNTKKLMNFTRFYNLTKFVSLYYFNEVAGGIQFARRYLYKIKIIYSTRGPKEAAIYGKLCRLAVTKALAGQTIPRPFGLALARDNLPKVIPSPFRVRILKGDISTIRWVLTVMQVTRLILGDPKSFTTDSIVAPGNGITKTVPEATYALVCRHMGLRRGQVSSEFTEFPWISTAGPNGLSILRSLEDSVNCPPELAQSLCTLAGPKFGECLKSVQIFWQHAKEDYLTNFKYSEAKSKYLRRISIKADKEGKSRPFAIFEYFSQAGLTPMHDCLYYLLNGFKWDCTFDQNKGFQDLLFGDYGFYASFDLTSATDRFPLWLEEGILEYVLDSKAKAKAWTHIMTGYPFRLPNGKSVQFSVGQPLGAKSSWAAFSLAHHFVVHYAYILSGSKEKEPLYRLLGDDIVIMDPLLAQSYQDVIQSLGVEISKTKSHISTDLFEFAKRFGYKGTEITPYPITGLYEHISQYAIAAQVAGVTARERGFLPPFVLSSSRPFWSDLVRTHIPENWRLFKSLVRKYELFFTPINSSALRNFCREPSQVFTGGVWGRVEFLSARSSAQKSGHRSQREGDKKA